LFFKEGNVLKMLNRIQVYKIRTNTHVHKYTEACTYINMHTQIYIVHEKYITISQMPSSPQYVSAGCLCFHHFVGYYLHTHLGNRNDISTLSWWIIELCVIWSNHQHEWHCWYKSSTDINPSSQRRTCSSLLRCMRMIIGCSCSSPPGKRLNRLLEINRSHGYVDIV
jgi:hypothetical protein